MITEAATWPQILAYHLFNFLNLVMLVSNLIRLHLLIQYSYVVSKINYSLMGHMWRWRWPSWYCHGSMQGSSRPSSSPMPSSDSHRSTALRRPSRPSGTSLLPPLSSSVTVTIRRLMLNCMFCFFFFVLLVLFFFKKINYIYMFA